MSGPGRRLRPLLAGSALLAALPVAVPGAGAARPDDPAVPSAAGGSAVGVSPWTAADHLRPEPEGITAPGWWVALGGVSRDAVEGEWEGSVRGGVTGSSVPGFVFGWRRVGGGDTVPTHDREVRLVVPWKEGRVSAGARLLQRDRRRALSVPVQVAVRTGGPFVAGSRVVLHPGNAAGSVDAVFFATAVYGRWMAALEAGPGAGYRGSLGIGITEGVLWLVSVTDLDPSYGLHFRLGRFEIRAETTPHRALGTLTRIRLVWGGSGS
jgi:hypothetical protein